MKQAIAFGPSMYGSLTEAQYKKYRDMIGGSRHDADDHMQEQCLKALEMCSTGVFRSIDQALEHLITARPKARRRDNKIVHVAPDKLDRHRDKNIDATSSVPMSNENDLGLWAAIEESIPAKLTDIAHMRIEERLTNREIAEQTGLHPKTVGYRYEEFCRRARRTTAAFAMSHPNMAHLASLTAA